MKLVSATKAKWPDCIEAAQKEAIVLTKNGKRWCTWWVLREWTWNKLS